MSEVETLYSARQLADELGITLQMLSKYAQAYSKLSKQQIMKQGRDGRHFTNSQREIIKNARDMVRSNTGVTVEDAMKRALVFDSAPLAVETGAVGAGVDLALLESTLRAALRDEVTTPLIAEMQALRAEMVELRREVPAAVKENPRQVENPAADRPHSLLIRMALRVESWLRR